MRLINALRKEMKMTTTADIGELWAHAVTHFTNNSLAESVDHLNRLLEADPHHKLGYLTRGSAHLKMGKTDEAAEDFGRVIEMDPDHAKAYHMRGLARELGGNDDGALDDFNKAIDLNPEYGAAFYSRATLLTKMGREDEATEDMQMVTHLTNVNIENFANENNVWRSRQMQLENVFETELNR
jgi:tetratricopeptide (TPR) repeat protein